MGGREEAKRTLNCAYRVESYLYLEPICNALRAAAATRGRCDSRQAVSQYATETRDMRQTDSCAHSMAACFLVQTELPGRTIDAHV